MHMKDDMLMRCHARLANTRGVTADLRNLVPIGYNYCIHGGYDIYPNRLGFLDHQLVSACSAQFVEQFGDPRGPF
jgi:hypothetical protein